MPAKEPLDVLERTLRAMRQVSYRGQVDVWILGEGDDPAVRAMTGARPEELVVPLIPGCGRIWAAPPGATS